MARGNDPLIEAALQLAWRQWCGLGVRGTVRPPSTPVDPEALLFFTATLVDHDPRLRDEVADWWTQYQSFISLSRLRGLRSSFGDAVAHKLDAMLATFAAIRTSGKSRLEHLATPARAWLRVRRAFGASARSEILLELYAHHMVQDPGLTALALARVGYSKRNIAFALDDLVMSGLVIVHKEGNRVRYRLADPDGFARMLAPLPRASGRWHFRLPILSSFIELTQRLHGRDAVVQGIEARKALEQMHANVVGANIASAPQAVAQTYWVVLQRWLIDTLTTEPEGTDAEDAVPRMIKGAWLAPGESLPRVEQSTGAVLPQSSAAPNRDGELLCLDLVQVPVVGASDWMWATLSEAAKSTYAHTIGMSRKEHWRFATWAFGKPRVYAVEYSDSIAHDGIARLYGELAAERARVDRPAVQLRLTRLDEATR